MSRKIGGVMYVIEDKKGRFFGRTKHGYWTRNIWSAFRYNTKRRAGHYCAKEIGERVFEVHLVLGKQVK